MLYVEDALILVARRLLFEDNLCGLLSGEWYSSFVSNMHAHISSGRSISTEQSRIILKIVERVQLRLVALGDVSAEDMVALLRSPTHRNPPYRTAQIKREVRFLGSNKLAFRFKFNDLIRRDLTNLKCDSEFNREHRIWIVSVTSETIAPIRKIIRHHRFELDDITENYLEECEAGIGKQTTVEIDSETGLLLFKVFDDCPFASWIATIEAGEAI